MNFDLQIGNPSFKSLFCSEELTSLGLHTSSKNELGKMTQKKFSEKL